MNQLQEPAHRDSYDYFARITTRWSDNDAYGHINNVVYHSFVDTAVNRHLLEQGVLDILGSETIGLVKENRCVYFSSIAFPDQIDVGLKVTHIGNSSVRYEIGIFKEDEPLTAAIGLFVHIYVDRITAKPTRVPDSVRAALAPLQSGQATS